MKEENVKSEYQRKVDKSLIPTCNIMGVNIAAINMKSISMIIVQDCFWLALEKQKIK